MSLLKFLAPFLGNRRGAVAIIFALTVIPIMGFVGGAIDYARAYMVKSRLQSALDSAVLAAGATATMSNAERIDYANKVFVANYPKSEIGVVATPKITISSDGVIKGTVVADIDSTILGVIGINKFDVGASSEAKIVANLEGEIVLVLDYSGSMSWNGKYQAMRDATIDLVKTLSQNGTNEKVKFALVPFSADVYTTLPKSFVVEQTGVGTWTNCTADRKWPYNTEDTTPVANDDTKWGFFCPVSKDDDDKKKKKDDDDDDDKKKKKDDDDDKKEAKCTVYDHCAEYPKRNLIVRPLTNDKDVIVNQLKSMWPLGNTHISLGLEFGWHVISPNPPYEEGVPYGTKNLIKAIVLLTDGQQTSKGWGPSYASSVSQAEKNLEAMCTAIKAKGVTMVTVAFDLSDQTTRDRLSKCATSSSHFFDAKSNSDLAKAFQAITNGLAKNLHLSQ